MKHEIIYRDPRDLIAYENNSRVHSADQIDRIKSSIKEFGFINPVLIDVKDTIIAGHARTESAVALGIKEIPTILVNNLTEQQVKAYVIADNKLAELSTWDNDLLRIEIDILGRDGFDIDVIGFNADDLSKLFDETEDIEIDDMIEELDEFEISIRGNAGVRVDVLNAINAAVRDFADVEILCNEQV